MSLVLKVLKAKLASLQPQKPKSFREAWACLQLLLLEATRWLTCCCCYQCRKPFSYTKPGKKEDWSAHRKAATCPAQLKVSTIDKRTIGEGLSHACLQCPFYVLYVNLQKFH